MERKIFNSDKSRIRLNFNFKTSYWWIRSTDSLHRSITCAITDNGTIDDNGYVYYVFTFKNYGVLPACTI